MFFLKLGLMSIFIYASVIVCHLFVRHGAQGARKKLSDALELEFRIQGSQDTGRGFALAKALLSILLGTGWGATW